MDLTKEEVIEFFGLVYKGTHNIPNEVQSYDGGFCMNYYGSMSTFDSDELTRLVFAAHDACLRLTVCNSGPNMIKVVVHRRYRTANINSNHPKLEDAVAKWREQHSEIAVLSPLSKIDISEVTYKQTELMRHTLGMQNNKISYRNHFVATAGHPYLPDLLALEKLGLMGRYERFQGDFIFYVNLAGRLAISELIKKHS